uniref:Uncharacterized protein n=1 Tax=Arundo donax TaxID=35708 RepID=A0A0A9DKK7_ARUDO
MRRSPTKKWLFSAKSLSRFPNRVQN